MTIRQSTEERQKQIIKTAMWIINEEGYLSLTTRRLATEIGVSEPALYRHFASKDDILIGIIKSLDELWIKVLDEVKRHEAKSEKIGILLDMHFSYIEKNPEILAILLADEYIRLNDRVRDYLCSNQQKRYDFILSLFDGDDEADVKASIIMGAIRITALQWRNSGYKFSLTERGKRVKQVLMNLSEKNNPSWI